MDRRRRMFLGVVLTMPWSKVSVDTYRVIVFAASACNVDDETPVAVLALLADSSSAIVWC